MARRLRFVGATWLFLLAATSPAEARSSVDHDAALWLMLFGQGRFEESERTLGRLRWWLDIQQREFGDGSDQTLLRPGLGYQMDDATSVWLGYAWIDTSAASGPTTNEHRIWQQLLWTMQLWQGRARPSVLTSRTRLEQRFLDNGDDVGWRARQLVKLTRPFDFEPRLGLAAYDEIFFNLNDTDWGASSGLDQNRLFAGLAWTFDEARRFTLEVGYLNQFLYRSGSEDDMNHILNINLLVNL